MYDLANVAGIIGGPATSPIGLPSDNQASGPPPGFESTVASVQPPPPISTMDKLWDTVKQDSQSALSWTEDEVKIGYNNARTVAGTVISDVASPIANATSGALKSVYWYAIVAVVVLAGAIYFIGKGGAIKVNAIV